MTKIEIAIDPGKNGGIAFSIGDEPVGAVRMPATMTDLHAALLEISAKGTVVRVLVENTGTYRPGNSGPGAVKFARHCGHIEALVYALGLPCEQIPANRWMKSFLGTVPKAKKDRKLKIKEKVQRLYPHLDVTLLTADALGLLNVLQNSRERIT